jgi:hypothetical protein
LETRTVGASYRIATDALWHLNRANAEESQEGQSKADFIAKRSISSKEAREMKMLRSAILTARESPSRRASRG